MKTSNTGSEKIFIGLGIITIVSGLIMAIQENVFIGICGSIVGLWLTVENVRKLKAKKEGEK